MKRNYPQEKRRQLEDTEKLYKGVNYPNQRNYMRELAMKRKETILYSKLYPREKLYTKAN